MPRLRRTPRAALLVFGLASFAPSLVPPLNAQAPLEITRIDLFARKGWNSMQVSVRGFRLGMERKEAVGNAQSEDLNLDDVVGQGCLKEKVCDVFSAGKPIGVALALNADDVVESITIDAFKRNTSRDERAAWLSTSLMGDTRNLAADYSENARIRTLGHADKYEAKVPGAPSRWSGRTVSPGVKPVRWNYYYSRLGLILHLEMTGTWITVDPAGATVQGLTFEFVRPQTAAR